MWSLEDCINYAIAHNISVKDASLNTNLAEVDYSKAKSSRYQTYLVVRLKVFLTEILLTLLQVVMLPIKYTVLMWV